MIIITDFDEQNFTCKINALWSINIIYLSLEWAAETMVYIHIESVMATATFAYNPVGSSICDAHKIINDFMKLLLLKCVNWASSSSTQS